MAAIAAKTTREDKQKWLNRPFNWAYNVSFFGGFFGFVYWYFGVFDTKYLAVALIGVCAVNFALMLWGFSRLHYATTRRY